MIIDIIENETALARGRFRCNGGKKETQNPDAWRRDQAEEEERSFLERRIITTNTPARPTMIGMPKSSAKPVLGRLLGVPIMEIGRAHV